MPATKEELIAKAILDAQRRHQTSNHTELGNVLSSDAFSSMPFDQKADVIKHYAQGVDHEPNPTKWQNLVSVLKGGVSGAATQGGGTLLLGALPFAMQEALHNKAPSEIGKNVMRGVSRVARPVLLFTGGMGAWAKHQQLKDEKHVRGYTNELLQRIRETKEREEQDRTAYELLASSSHNFHTGNALRGKAKKINQSAESVSTKIYQQALRMPEPEPEMAAQVTPSQAEIVEQMKRRLRGEE